MLITIQFTAPIKLNFRIKNSLEILIMSDRSAETTKTVFQEFPGKILKKSAAIYELLVGKYPNIVNETCWSHFITFQTRYPCFESGIMSSWVSAHRPENKRTTVAEQMLLPVCPDVLIQNYVIKDWIWWCSSSASENWSWIALKELKLCCNVSLWSSTAETVCTSHKTTWSVCECSVIAGFTAAPPPNKTNVLIHNSAWNEPPILHELI